MTAPIQKFRIILEQDKFTDGKLQVVVTRDQLLQNLDYYEKQKRRWVVVKA